MREAKERPYALEIGEMDDGGGGVLRVLIADDLAEDRALIRRTLERELGELDVVEVGERSELVEALQGPAPDAVVLDYALGWTDGITLLDEVRERWPFCATVMFTATGDEAVAVEAMKRDLDDYVVKSVSHLKRLPVAVNRAIERRRRMKKLGAVEREMSALLERLTEGIYRTTMEGKLLYANPALLRMLGVADLDEATAVDVSTWYVDPAERRRWLRRLDREEAPAREFRIRRRDGEETWLRDRARVVRDAEGAVRFIEGVVLDVTDRRAAEEALALQLRYREMLQAVTSLANGADDLDEALHQALTVMCEAADWPLGHVYRVDREGDEPCLRPTNAWHVEGDFDAEAFRAVTVETTFAEGVGIPGRVLETGTAAWMTDLPENPTFLRSAPHSDHGVRTAVGVPVVTGEEVVAVIELFHPHDREEDPALSHALTQAGVQLGRVVERERANRERTRMEAGVREAQKMQAVGRLAGGIAHDFNNLLTVILMEGRTARAAGGAAPPEVVESIDAILDASERAAQLTRQLLTFARGGEKETQVFPVNDVVEDLEPMLDRMTGDPVELVTVLGDEAACVRADRSEFEQVLVNLVVNARDSMPAGGTILVETGRRELQLRGADSPGLFSVVSVSDEGTGIPPEIRDRVMEPFFTTKEEGGTGLGLSICYSIAQEAGGELRIYSEEGVGTTVRVILPLVEGEGVESREEQAVPVGTETVIVVEDDDEVRRVTCRALEAQGYTVIQARDGAEALDRILTGSGDACPVDLVLSDVILPKVRGPEVVRRARERFPGLPALLMSGYSEALMKRRTGNQTDEPDIMQKPFSLSELARRVRKAIDTA